MTDDLQPIAPADAVEFYVDSREDELSEKSLTNQRYRLNSFVEWAGEAGLDSMHQLTGRDLHEFRVWRSQGNGEKYDPVSTVTLSGILQTLRVFLEFCASIDAVEPGLRERVMIPDVDREDESDDTMLSEEYAGALLDYLAKFEYASRDHVVIGLLWHTGVRLGTLRALDVDDFDPQDRCLWVRHRPESGTPLKNQRAAERAIALGDDWIQTLREYIDNRRDDVMDDHGRAPLITSSQGRLTEVPIRQTVYKWTRPCMIAECPHDKDPDTCEWIPYERASGCPSSVSPHAVRRGAITRQLREGAPEHVVSDRMNVSEDVLDQHYDERTEFEKMETRRDFLEGL
jgi:site-specific recombinase XerD